MPPSLSQRLADRFTAHDVDLLQLEAGTRGEILQVLEGAERNIIADLAKRNPLNPAQPQFTQRRLAALLQQVQKTIKTAYRSAHATNDKAMVGWAEIERDRTQDIVNDAVQVKLLNVGVPTSTLRALAHDDIVRGFPAKAWWGKQATATYDRFKRTMQDAVVRNQTPAEAARRIRGTRELNYKDGLMALSRADAQALTRTSLLSIANRTRHETLKANSDVLRGVEVQVTLDLRTSVICRGLSGGCWDFEGQPLPESPRQEKFPGQPPYHWNCRTTLIPVVKNYQDLIGSKAETAPEVVEAEDNGHAQEILAILPPGARANPEQAGMIDIVKGWIKTRAQGRTLFSARTAAGDVSGVLDMDVKKTFAEIKAWQATSSIARNSLFRDAAQRALETKNKRLFYTAPAAEQAALKAAGWLDLGGNRFVLNKSGIQNLLNKAAVDDAVVSANKAKQLRALPPSAQASMDGQVAGALDYEGWLRGQSEARQRAVLGKRKFEAWQKNEIALRDLIDQSQHPRTIDEMRAIMANRKARQTPDLPIPPKPAPVAPPVAPKPAPPKPPAAPPAKPALAPKPEPKVAPKVAPEPKPAPPKPPGRSIPPPSDTRIELRQKPYFRLDIDDAEQLSELNFIIKETTQELNELRADVKFRLQGKEPRWVKERLAAEAEIKAKEQSLAAMLVDRLMTAKRLMQRMEIPPARSEIGLKLQSGKPTTIKPLGGGVNETFKVELHNGETGVWKPMTGEQKGREGIEAGEYFVREGLVSDIAELVGMRDLVPETVIRTIGDEIGSLQRFKDGFKAAANAGGNSAGANIRIDVERSLVMNFILGNSDRHYMNWMVRTEGATAESPLGKMALIDNGLQLSAVKTDPIRIWYVDNIGEQTKQLLIPDDLKTPWRQKWQDVERLMKNYGIDKDAIELARERFDLVMHKDTTWIQVTNRVSRH